MRVSVPFISVHRVKKRIIFPARPAARVIIRLHFVWAAWMLTATGCITNVKSVPVTSDNSAKIEGIRYALPKPVLRIVPQGDGTIQVGIEYLPDSAHTYVLQTSSYFGSHKAEIQRDGEFLTKFAFSSDESGVAASAIKASGDVIQSVIAAQIAARDAATKSVQAAEDALRAKQATLAAENAKLAALQAQGATSDVLNQEQLTIVQAKADVSAAQADLDVAQQRAVATPVEPASVSESDTAAGATDTSNLTAGTQTTHSSFAISAAGVSSVLGPVIYSIDERVIGPTSRPTVLLRAINIRVNGDTNTVCQQEIPTTAPTTSPSQATATTGAPVRMFGSGIIVPDSSGNANLSLQSSVPLSGVRTNVQVSEIIKGEKTPVQGKVPPIISLSDPTHVIINMNGYDAGDYELLFGVIRDSEGSGGPEPATTIRVRLTPKSKAGS